MIRINRFIVWEADVRFIITVVGSICRVYLNRTTIFHWSDDLYFQIWIKLLRFDDIVGFNFVFWFFFRFAYHCSECEFDVCPDCFKPHPTPLHAHPLYKSKSQDVCSVFSDFWKCDNCGSPQSSVADNKPWHCPTCKYNLCHSCMRATNEGIMNRNTKK